MPTSWLLHWVTNVYDRGLRYSDLGSYEGWWREECQRSAIMNALPQDVWCTCVPATGEKLDLYMALIHI